MDVDSAPTRPPTGEHSGDRVKRKSSLLKESAPDFRYHSKRTKKHPSPSKAELEGMEKFLQEHPLFGTSETLVLADADADADADAVEEMAHLREAIVSCSNDCQPSKQTPINVGCLIPASILASKDPNPKIKDTAKLMEKRRGIGLFPKPHLSRSGSSLPDIPRGPKVQKSLIPKPIDKANTKPRQDNRYSLRDEVFNDTAMDIDELQTDDSAFQIVKKA
jgi:hypothetical protein